MRKYNHIISQMTEGQKIRILTDFNGLGCEELSALGLPRLNMMNIEAFEELPSPAAMARSFNTRLISEVSTAAVQELAQRGADQIAVPTVRAAVGKRTGVLSEDPCLSASVGGAYIKGANDAGISAVLDGYSTDVGKYTSYHPDGSADSEVVYKNLTKPFEEALDVGKCDGVIADGEADLKNSNTPIIRRKTTEDNTVEAIFRGEICLHGSGAELRRAINNYRHLKSKIERGKTTAEVLERAVACNEAISEEMLDDALDVKLDYIFRCAKTGDASPEGNTAELRKRAYEGACVLLENNDSTLPLSNRRKKRKGKGIAIIGDAVNCFGNSREEAEKELSDRGYICAGYAQGYDLKETQSDRRLKEAEALADKADTVLLFLSMDSTGQYKTVPANLAALCYRLCFTRSRLIVVISCDGNPDLAFLQRLPNPPSAVLLAPLAMPKGVVNAMRVIFGDYSPAGRLPFHFADKDSPASHRKGYKIQQFTGYRYYDKAGFGTVYPFGHGLGYTKFKYSGLSVDGSRVSFSVKNSGKRDGVAVAQVYLGMDKSSRARPLKELVGFAAVPLEAGEKRDVSLNIQDLMVYDAEKAEWVTEKGSYTVYVGESVFDIRLKKKCSRGESIIKPDGKDICEYFITETNIFKDNYVLEAKYKPMKSTFRNLFVGITALILAVAVKIYDIVMIQNSIFLNILAVLLLAGSILFFVLEICDKKKKLKADRAAMEKASSKLFADADRINVPSAKELFAVAQLPDSYDEQEEVKTEDAEEAYDHFGDVDKNLDFTVYAEEFARFAKEKGVSLSRETANSILASLAASRLVIVKGMSSEKFSLLNSLLCEYLGCRAGIDNVDQTYIGVSDVFLYPSEQPDGSTVKNACKTVYEAAGNPKNIHLIALNNVKLAFMSDYFSACAKYIRMPQSSMTLQLTNCKNQEVFLTLPENLWFMLNLAENERLDDIPGYIAETATVNSWDINVGPIGLQGVSDFHSLYYGQLVYMVEKVSAEFSLDETVCKKIDRLENFCARYSDFKVGNKMWLSLEIYAAVLRFLGEDEGTAMDKAIAVKLMAGAIAAVSGKISRDERSLSEAIDVYFGEEHTAECHKVIKTSGANIL